MSEANNSPFSNQKAGEAFLIDPKDGAGPGVLVLHSWWGLNPWVKEFCKRLTNEGYTSLAPDLLGGELPETEEAGELALGQVNPDKLSGLVLSSAQTIRAASKDAQKPIAVIGFSMGASLAFWLAAKLPHNVNSVVAFYGTQAIDFDDATAKFMGHFGLNDHMVSDDERVATESFIRLGGNETEFYTYPDTKHWFFEAGHNYNQDAADLAWDRTKTFLEQNIK